jgi:glycosyltransferase involved in cell wall biosynthesis
VQDAQGASDKWERGAHVNIGFAGPVSLQLLQSLVADGESLPRGYVFPATALWVKELLARGHRVSLYTLAPEVDSPRTFLGDRLTIRVGRYRNKNRARDLFWVERQDLLTMMGQDDCDVIHAHWTYEFALAALDSGKPTVVTAHDAPLSILKLHPDPYRLVRTAMAWRVARMSNCMTAVSPYVAEHFRKWFLFDHPMHVVPNGIADEFFSRVDQAAMEPKSGELTFACVLTGWSALKNGQAALLAFRRVRESLSWTRLLLIGNDYGQNEPAHHWALQHGCAEGVEFLGSVPYAQLLETLASRVDVLVHPSLEESFGMVLAEAMALHIPAIAGEYSGGVPFVLDYGKAGILVDVRHPERIATAMEELARNPQQRVELAEAGYDSAKRRFHLQTVTEQYEAVYHSALSGKR